MEVLDLAAHNTSRHVKPSGGPMNSKVYNTVELRTLKDVSQARKPEGSIRRSQTVQANLRLSEMFEEKAINCLTLKSKVSVMTPLFCMRLDLLVTRFKIR